MKSAGGLLFLFAIALFAQTGAVVEGTVTDSVTHKPLAGVTVTLDAHQEQRDESYTATTDASGSFRMVGIRPGEYLSIYEKDGFRILLTEILLDFLVGNPLDRPAAPPAPGVGARIVHGHLIF